MTLNELWRNYESVYGSRRKSIREYARLFLRHVAPRLGDRECDSIPPREFASLHDSMSATPFQANRCMAVCSKLYSFAARRGYTGDNFQTPTRHIERYPEPARSRFANREEFKNISGVLALENGRTAALLKCLMLTGARPAELSEAKTEYLKGNVLRLPDSKTGKPRNIFFNTQAMAILKEVPAQKDGTLFGVSAQAAAKLWRKLRVKAGVPDMRMYPDLRRTFATMGVAAGVSIDQMGGLLGHLTRQTTMIYAKLVEDSSHAAAQTAGDFITL